MRDMAVASETGMAWEHETGQEDILGRQEEGRGQGGLDRDMAVA